MTIKSPADWDKIEAAYEIVARGDATRIAGQTWTVYTLADRSDLIRIDIRQPKPTPPDRTQELGLAWSEHP